MKELSIEEKAKAYDEAIKKGKQIQNTPYTAHWDIMKEVVEHLFPELKESEDESIRKGLLSHLRELCEYKGINPPIKMPEHYSVWIDWLEKQGKQNPQKTSIWKHWKDGIAGNGEGKLAYLVKSGNTYMLRSCLGFECDYIELSELYKLLSQEKQGEQKPETFIKFRIGDKVTNGEDTYTINFIGKDRYWVKENNCDTIPFEYQHHWKLVEQNHTDKVEPKFEAGDWVVIDGEVLHVKKVTEDGYLTDEGLIPFRIEKEAHIWSIADAEDGDVLYCKSGDIEYIVMSKGVNERGHIDSYFRYNSLDGYGFGVDIPSVLSTRQDNITPATKEQREYLFQKMKEAGYEWDAENKELKKIEQTPCMIQKPCMIQWKGNNLKEVIDFTGKSKNFDKWFKSFEEYEKYVNDHNGIFKMFCEDGSHYEVPVGAWIVKTPDGYNVASKAIFIQKPAWSEKDEKEYRRVEYAIMKVFGGDTNMIGWIRKFKNKLLHHTAWKPSDEQIESLQESIGIVGELTPRGELLKELMEQLKKLREE